MFRYLNDNFMYNQAVIFHNANFRWGGGEFELYKKTIRNFYCGAWKKKF